MAEQSKAPYEEALSKGIEKLTSEIFIFLLCYTILLIGMAVLGTKLPTELRTLLYILPVLGIGPYLWLRRQQLMTETQKAKDNLLAQTEARKMEKDEKIAELEAENARLKNLVITAKGVVGGLVAGVAGTENDSPEFVEAVAKLKLAVDAENVSEGGQVGGLLIKKNDLAERIQSLDEETQNSLKGLVLYLQKISKNGTEDAENLATLIKRVPDLKGGEKLNAALKAIKDLT